MTTTHAAPSLAPGTITRRLRAAGHPIDWTHTIAPGAVRVSVRVSEGGACVEARRVAADLRQAGYEVVRTGAMVVVTLPESVNPGEPLGEVVENTVRAAGGTIATREARLLSGEETVEEARARRDAERAELAAAALQAGYDATRTGEVVTITEPAEEVDADALVDEVAARHGIDAPRIITTRPVGAGLAEVALDGQAIGRLRNKPRGLVDAYTTTGERVGVDLTRDLAHALLVEHADAAEPVQVAHLMSDDLLDACGTAAPGGLHLAPSSTPERITCRRCLLIAVDEEVRRLGYRSAAAYLQSRPGLEGRVRVAAIAPDGPALPRAEEVDEDAVLVERVADAIADAIADARPALPILRPGVDPNRAAAELEARPLTPGEVDTLNAAHLLTVDRLRAAAAEPGPEVDDPREEPRPLEWSSVARP